MLQPSSPLLVWKLSSGLLEKLKITVLLCLPHAQLTLEGSHFTGCQAFYKYLCKCNWKPGYIFYSQIWCIRFHCFICTCFESLSIDNLSVDPLVHGITITKSEMRVLASCFLSEMYLSGPNSPSATIQVQSDQANISLGLSVYAHLPALQTPILYCSPPQQPPPPPPLPPLILLLPNLCLHLKLDTMPRSFINMCGPPQDPRGMWCCFAAAPTLSAFRALRGSLFCDSLKSYDSIIFPAPVLWYVWERLSTWQFYLSC